MSEPQGRHERTYFRHTYSRRYGLCPSLFFREPGVRDRSRGMRPGATVPAGGALRRKRTAPCGANGRRLTRMGGAALHDRGRRGRKGGALRRKVAAPYAQGGSGAARRRPLWAPRWRASAQGGATAAIGVGWGGEGVGGRRTTEAACKRHGRVFCFAAVDASVSGWACPSSPPCMS